MASIDCDGEDPTCHCVVSDLLGLLGRKYVMDIVCVMSVHETVRFGDLEDHLPGASTSTLSTRLDELEDAGLVARERFDEIPPRVEYRLTDEGAELGERLRPVAEWVAEREELAAD
ncbi:winged helix-turn-helix transcriptional regulator [Halobacteriales archaeon Cl-PHB]